MNTDDGGDVNRGGKKLSRKQQERMKNSSASILVPELTIQAAVYDAERYAANMNANNNDNSKNDANTSSTKKKREEDFQNQLSSFVGAEKKNQIEQEKQRRREMQHRLRQQE